MPLSDIERAEISRQNGRKSRGPKTREGKQRASQNSTKHGLYAQTVVLPYESKRGFRRLQADFHERFQARDAVEAALVDRLVSATWRLTRAYGVETGTIAFSLLDSKNAVEEQY